MWGRRSADESGRPFFEPSEQALAGLPVRRLQDDDEDAARPRGGAPVAGLEPREEARDVGIEPLGEEVEAEPGVDLRGVRLGGIKSGQDESLPALRFVRGEDGLGLAAEPQDGLVGQVIMGSRSA